MIPASSRSSSSESLFRSTLLRRPDARAAHAPIRSSTASAVSMVPPLKITCGKQDSVTVERLPRAQPMCFRV
jgi:hypothetical protein